ncbi:MAG: PfkB family carbohydrate kinase [Candidatus Berkelbacteria bacterium]|nr:PfkB family carbohydrate kinase [Candidatus Berkelbacteria bacterium]
MDLIIVGSLGLDDIITPFGKATSNLGGSTAYASLAASFFIKPGIVSIVGNDMPRKNLQVLKKRGIDLEGLSFGKKTFRWSGFYEYDMNEAKTLKTELNSITQFNPILPNNYRNADYVLLGNIDPEQQLKVLKQTKKEAFVLIDSMNFWIENKKAKLLQAIKKANLVLLNDSEARQLSDTPNLVKSAKQILNLGVDYVVIKKGEHGALLFTNDDHFSAAGYPLENAKDPTGAGDCFAGGLIGFLAKERKTDLPTIKKGIVYGSAIASFCTEKFGVENLIKINLDDIKERYEIFRKIREF